MKLSRKKKTAGHQPDHFIRSILRSADPCVPAQLVSSALRPMTTVFATTRAPPVATVFVVSLILLPHSCVKLHFTTCHTFMFIKCQVIRLMDKILHHLGWLKLINNGIIIILGGAGFCPSTVVSICVYASLFFTFKI